MATDPEDRVLLAVVGAAHGVRGEVRIKPFTSDPLSIGAYGPLQTEDGRSFEIVALRPSKTVVVARLKGIADRNEAEKLNGLKLYVAREHLPQTDDDEYYHADLIGLAVETLEGTVLGTVIGVPDFGAGDLLDVVPARGKGWFIPFTRAIVPVVDLKAGRILVDPPPGLLDDEEENPDAV